MPVQHKAIETSITHAQVTSCTEGSYLLCHRDHTIEHCTQTPFLDSYGTGCTPSLSLSTCQGLESSSANIPSPLQSCPLQHTLFGGTGFPIGTGSAVPSTPADAKFPPRGDRPRIPIQPAHPVEETTLPDPAVQSDPCHLMHLGKGQVESRQDSGEEDAGFQVEVRARAVAQAAGAVLKPQEGRPEELDSFSQARQCWDCAL